MTALEAVVAYTPPDSVHVDGYLPGFGLRSAQVRLYEHYYGFSRIPRDPDGRLTPLLHAAATALDQLPDVAERVRYLLHARTILVAVPYPLNPLHEVRGRLGLDHAISFTVTEHACASGLLAVDLAGRLLANDDSDALALVLTGEKAFTMKAQLIPDAAVMGEAAAAVLVRRNGSRDRVLGYATTSIWGLQPDPWSDSRPDRVLPQRYARALAEVVRAATARAGVVVGELALVLPHNVNRVTLLRLAKDLGIPAARLFLDNIPVTGHSFCADSFVNYAAARGRGLLRPGEPYLMTSVGLGTTFSAMVLRH